MGEEDRLIREITKLLRSQMVWIGCRFLGEGLDVVIQGRRWPVLESFR